MSETTPSEPQSRPSGSGGSALQGGGGGSPARSGQPSSELAGPRGSTTIADSVVTKVVGIAAREVPGVYALGGSTARALGAVTQRVGIGDVNTQGVGVEVGERQAAVDLTVVIEYGESIPQVSQKIRDHIIRRVEGITGLEVTEVNIAVDDLHFQGDEGEQAEPRVA
jgi:uncharacterized alkaline shock family protein YloU